MTAEQTLVSITGKPLEIKKVKVNIHEINYVTTGSGKPVILLHGANMGWGQWYQNIADLSNHFQIFALDFPGSGSSDDSLFSEMNFRRDYVDTLLDFIKEMGLQKVNIIGHSLGAWVGLKFAINYPDFLEKLVIVSPLGLSEKNSLSQSILGFKFMAELLSNTAVKPTRANMEHFLKEAMHRKEAISPEFVNYYLENLSKHLANHPFILINRLTGPLKVRAEFNLKDQLNKINQAVLVIASAHDKIARYNEDMQSGIKAIQKYQIEIFKESGHVPFMEEKAKFNSTVIDFLK